MKVQLIGLALFLATGAAVAVYPSLNNPPAAVTPALPPAVTVPAAAQQRQKIEVVFVLDTTGSMGGLIAAAKEKIWSIASTMATADPAPEINMGLVAYRDRGDQYVTRVIDLSSDLDSMYAQLMEFRADGGGDGPESVNQALYEAVHNISWSQDPNSYQVVFLVGDAPPHMDYQDDVKYPATLAVAKDRGIIINTIRCGDDPTTARNWQQIAQLAGGTHFDVGSGGDAVAIATPFDTKLAELSKELDATRLFYGDEEALAKSKEKVEATDRLHASASEPTKARRAAFNVSASGDDNFLAGQELVEDVSSGRVDLKDVDEAHLPAALQAMSIDERQAAIESEAGKRSELVEEIRVLAKKRDDFLEKEVAALGGAEASLDHQLYEAIREQGEDKGLGYGAAPKY